MSPACPKQRRLSHATCRAGRAASVVRTTISTLASAMRAAARHRIRLRRPPSPCPRLPLAGSAPIAVRSARTTPTFYTCGSKRPVSRAADAGVGAATTLSVITPAVGSAPGVQAQWGPAAEGRVDFVVGPSRQAHGARPPAAPRGFLGGAALTVVVLAAAGVAYLMGRVGSTSRRAARPPALPALRLRQRSDSGGGSASAADRVRPRVNVRSGWGYVESEPEPTATAPTWYSAPPRATRARW